MAKRGALRALFDREEVTNGIIFCNRKRDIGTLLESLQRHGYSAVSLHGDMDQHIRLKMLDEFKTGSVKYLIASDVAARGLDIPDVSHVFNFDVPSHAEDYVHRIGRTGRAGRTGAAFMLATRQDDKYVQAIQELIKQEIPREELAGLDTAGSEKPAAKAKPRRRKSDAEAKDAASSGGNGEGRRRGLLGRNKRKNPDKKTNGQANRQASGQAEAKPLPEKAQKAEAPAKPEKTGRGPRKDTRKDTGKDTGKAKNQSSDAFDGNMPDFLKKQIK